MTNSGDDTNHFEQVGKLLAEIATIMHNPSLSKEEKAERANAALNKAQKHIDVIRARNDPLRSMMDKVQQEGFWGGRR